VDDFLATFWTLALFGVALLFFALGATFLIPIIVGYVAFRWYNNAPSTIAKRDMVELRNLYSAIQFKLQKAGGPMDETAILRAAIQEAEARSGISLPPVAHHAAKAALTAIHTTTLPRFDETALAQSASLRSELRQTLYELDETHQYGSAPQAVYTAYLADALSSIFMQLPLDIEFDNPAAAMRVRLLDLLPDPKTAVENVMGAAFQPNGGATLLKGLQAQHEETLARIAKKTVEQLNRNPYALPKPSTDPRPALTVAEDFLGGSPFLRILLAEATYSLPPESRLEHMHLLAGSGHGKTQTLQSLIAADLVALAEAREAATPPRSVVVIDSQGDLIRTVRERKLFAPGELLADRLVVVDPTDLLHPPALNMFDMGQDRFGHLSPQDRAALYNGTVELYVYLFSELLEAQLTARQATLFRFLAKLLLVIPGATLTTFLDLLEDDPACLAHVSKLDETARHFFATQYRSAEFKSPKKEVAWRLWGLIANPALSAMFNSPTNKIDLHTELQRGAVVLIDTSKDTLKADGSKLFGRFWLALLAQAALKRAQVPPSQRVPTHIYLDEAHEIVDAKAEEILNQARKYKMGLTISHQNLDQLKDTATRSSVAASTAIKLIGGASDKDARAYASDVRSTSAHILSAQKTAGVGTQFVGFVKNHMEHGVLLSVPFGQLERLPAASARDRAALQAANRDRYCYPRPEEPEAPFRPAPEKPAPASAAPVGGGAADEPYAFTLEKPEAL